MDEYLKISSTELELRIRWNSGCEEFEKKKKNGIIDPWPLRACLILLIPDVKKILLDVIERDKFKLMYTEDAEEDFRKVTEDAEEDLGKVTEDIVAEQTYEAEDQANELAEREHFLFLKYKIIDGEIAIRSKRPLEFLECISPGITPELFNDESPFYSKTLTGIELDVLKKKRPDLTDHIDGMRQIFTPIRVLEPYYFDIFKMIIEKSRDKEIQAMLVKFCNGNEKNNSTAGKLKKKLIEFIDPCNTLIKHHLISIGVLEKDNKKK